MRSSTPHIAFVVLGRPVPMPHGETYRNKWAFKDHPVVAWKTLVGLTARKAMREAGLEMIPKGVDVGLSLQFGIVRLADLKNLTWAVEDAMNGICYHDDRQISHYVEPFKRYLSAVPGVEIAIYER